MKFNTRFFFLLCMVSCNPKNDTDSYTKFLVKHHLTTQSDAAKWELYKNVIDSRGTIQTYKEYPKICNVRLLACDLKLDTVWGIKEKFDSTYAIKLDFYYNGNEISLCDNKRDAYSIMPMSKVGFSKKNNNLLYLTDFRAFQYINSKNDSFKIQKIVNYYHTNPDSINPWLIEKLKSLNYIK